LTDIFAVQDEIASAIAATLARRLREAAGGAATPPGDQVDAPTRRARQRVSVEAYDEYLKGLHANRSFDGGGHPNPPAHFQRAPELQPEFAAAHAGLGETYLWFAMFFKLAPTDAFGRLRRHAQRAHAFDPELPDAHWLLGEVAWWHDWDADVSESHARRALAL